MADDDIDDQIAKLEAELQAIASDSESDSDENDNDVIPPLPVAYLPTITQGKAVKKEKKKIKKEKRKMEILEQSEPVEDMSTEGMSKKAKQMELMDYINGYTVSERLPFNCRICKVQV